jgi:uncharacterized membrane protein
MRSRERPAGHAVHPLLIVLPLSLLGMSVAFDLIGMLTGLALWGPMACWNLAVGILAGLLAGFSGLLDLLDLPAHTRASKVGLFHAIANLAALALFTVSFAARVAGPAPLPGPGSVALSLSGMAVAVVSGWLGTVLSARLAAQRGGAA